MRQQTYRDPEEEENSSDYRTIVSGTGDYEEVAADWGRSKGEKCRPRWGNKMGVAQGRSECPSPCPAPSCNPPQPELTESHGRIESCSSSMAHRAMDAVMGPQTIQQGIVASEAAAPAPAAHSIAGSDACCVHSRAFQD
ncbi:Hypothetical predicted protein, partial [Olea europaea subsp. europaea]